MNWLTSASPQRPPTVICRPIHLTFSLDAASLALGMTIDANTGVFSWTPTEGQGGLTPSVTVTVTDDGTGNLVDTETFTITVSDVNVAPVLGAIGDQVGQ